MRQSLSVSSHTEDIASETTFEPPPQVMRSLVNNNDRTLKIPTKGGHWTEEPGNSKFIPDDGWKFWNGLKRVSGKYLKEKYGFSAIRYRSGEPDFYDFADPLLGSVWVDKMPDHRNKLDGSYALAIDHILKNGIMADKKSVKKYMKEHDLVWHECGDGHTIIAIPREINAAFGHTGGIGIRKGLKRIAYCLNTNFGKMTLTRNNPLGSTIVVKSFPKKYRQVHR